MTPAQSQILAALTRPMSVRQITEALTGDRAVVARQRTHVAVTRLHEAGLVAKDRAGVAIVWTRTESGAVALAEFERLAGVS